MRNSKILFFVFLIIATSVFATVQDKGEINILFIGNSFTARHNLSELVKKVFEEGNSDLNVNVSKVIYGGQSLFQHTEYYFSQTFIEQGSIEDSTIQARINKMEDYLAVEEIPDEFIHYFKDIQGRTTVPDFPKNLIGIAINRHKNLLNNNPKTKWDYVVLQSWMDEFPDMNEGYAKYAMYLTNIANEQGAEVILYITAPNVQNQAPVTAPLKQENVDQEISFVLELAKEIQPYAVVHVPMAINMIQQSGTELTFRYVNDFHPNQRTAFLTANMFYAAFFNESTEGFDFNTVTETMTHSSDSEPVVKLDPDDGPATVVFEGEEKNYLQQMAYNAVLKFVQWWKGGGPIPVSEISILNAPSDTLGLGKSYQLIASTKPLYATDKNIKWEVTSGNAVTVDENGLVNAVAEGKAIIKAKTTDGGPSDSCEINVKKKIVSVYGIMIGNCPNFILQTGDAHQLTANVAPMDATDKSVTWSSSNPEVATVDMNGLVSANSQGTAKIAVTTNDGGYTNSCSLGIQGVTEVNIKEMEENLLGGVEIYPIPASEVLNFRFSESVSEKKIYLYNTLGQLLFSKTTYNSNPEINIREFSSEEMLIVKVITDEASASFKVVVNTN